MGSSTHWLRRGKRPTARPGHRLGRDASSSAGHQLAEGRNLDPRLWGLPAGYFNAARKLAPESAQYQPFLDEVWEVKVARSTRLLGFVAGRLRTCFLKPL